MNQKRGDQLWPEVNAWRWRCSLSAIGGEGWGEVAPTRLPERPDYAWANEFLLKARRDAAKHE